MMSENLKLDEAIGRLPNDAIFKLGYKNGSEFLFVGTKEEYFYKHDELAKTTQAMTKDAIRVNDEKIDKTVKRIEKLMGEIHGCLSSIKTAHSTNLLARKLVDVDLADLEVKETYDSIDDAEEPSKIIMVEGFVKGKYWTVSEDARERNKIQKKIEEQKANEDHKEV